MSLSKRGKGGAGLYNGHRLGGINRGSRKGDILDLVRGTRGLHTGNTPLHPDTVFKLNDFPKNARRGITAGTVNGDRFIGLELSGKKGILLPGVPGNIKSIGQKDDRLGLVYGISQCSRLDNVIRIKVDEPALDALDLDRVRVGGQ